MGEEDFPCPAPGHCTGEGQEHTFRQLPEGHVRRHTGNAPDPVTSNVAWVHRQARGFPGLPGVWTRSVVEQGGHRRWRIRAVSPTDATSSVFCIIRCKEAVGASVSRTRECHARISRAQHRRRNDREKAKPLLCVQPLCERSSERGLSLTMLLQRSRMEQFLALLLSLQSMEQTECRDPLAIGC
jgi:hypothetical protein